MSKETIWSFTCTECKNWWSYSTNGSWYPRLDMFCPHCGCVQSAEQLQGQNIRGYNRKELAAAISEDKCRSYAINETGTWGQVEIVLRAGHPDDHHSKQHIYCPISSAEIIGHNWLIYKFIGE